MGCGMGTLLHLISHWETMVCKVDGGTAERFTGTTTSCEYVRQAIRRSICTPRSAEEGRGHISIVGVPFR